MNEGLKIVPPLAITPAMLLACDVPENDYPVYAAGTTYAASVYVIHDRVVYLSQQPGNMGHTPPDSPTWWKKVRATNRWRIFDESNSTMTTAAGSMSYTLKPGTAVNVIALLGLVGASVRVRVTVPGYGTPYDKTFSLTPLPAANWWAYLFGSRMPKDTVTILDVACPVTGTITLDFAGGTVGCATCILGQAISIGEGIQLGATVGIKDYSRKEENEFGDVELVERPYAKRAAFTMRLAKSEVDYVGTLLASRRAKPTLYIGSRLYGSTVVFGLYDDWEVAIEYALFSVCNLNLKGLT
mgnify:CR=1 FL=1